MKRNVRIAMVALAACLTTGAALAQDQTTDKDKDFVKDASQGGLTEVMLSKIALQKSKNADVRQFAQKMVTDHTMLNNKMKPVAMKLGVQPDKKLNDEHMAEATKLRSLSGDDFNKEYVTYMVQDHHKDVKDFQDEADSTQNAKLKMTVQNGLTVIKEHTSMIDGIAQKMSIPTPSGM